MNPFYNGSHRYLAPDDIAGIRSLYGGRNPINTSGVSCSGATLFVNNIPTGATINWVSSNTGIATVANTSNQGIVSRTGTANGTVRITATITLPCGLNVVEFIDLPIGAPMASDILGMDPGVYLSAGQVLNLYIDEPGSAYDWYIGGATVLSSTTDPYITVKLDKCFPGQQAMNNFSAAVTYTNGCGTSPWKGENAYAVCGGGEDPEWLILRKRKTAPATGRQAGIYPNPTSGIVYVNLPAQSTGKTVIRVYDLHGRQLKEFTPAAKIVSINIADLASGVYMVEVSDGVTVFKEKVVKQ